MFWKALIWIAHQLVWLLPLIALWVFMSDADKGRTALEIGEGRVAFTPNRRALWVGPVVVAYIVYGSAYHALHSKGHHFQLFESVLVGSLALALLFSFPGTIIMSEEGVAQVRWYWSKKFIPWREIAEISTGKGGGAVTVTSANGVKVIYAPSLADRPRFMQEVGGHCGDNLPPEFPRG
jgi:hypothetical protein